MFSTADLNQFKSIGIEESVVLKQIDNLKNGFPYLKIKDSIV